MTDELFKKLKAIKQKVDRCIAYESDQTLYDTPDRWVSYRQQIKNGLRVRMTGDSGDFAITYAEFCADGGIDPQDVRIVFCMVKGIGYHMVCVVDSWVLCNNQTAPVWWDDLDYHFIKYMRLSEKGTWHQIT
jgi:predicted transglutaminase-like cysteine proteinase